MSIALTTEETRLATGLILLTMSLGVLIAQIDGRRNEDGVRRGRLSTIGRDCYHARG